MRRFRAPQVSYRKEGEGVEFLGVREGSLCPCVRGIGEETEGDVGGSVLLLVLRVSRWSDWAGLVHASIGKQFLVSRL